MVLAWPVKQIANHAKEPTVQFAFKDSIYWIVQQKHAHVMDPSRAQNVFLATQHNIGQDKSVQIVQL